MISSLLTSYLLQGENHILIVCGHVKIATKLPNSAQLTTKIDLPFGRNEQHLKRTKLPVVYLVCPVTTALAYSLGIQWRDPQTPAYSKLP